MYFNLVKYTIFNSTYYSIKYAILQYYYNLTMFAAQNLCSRFFGATTLHAVPLHG